MHTLVAILLYSACTEKNDSGAEDTSSIPEDTGSIDTHTPEEEPEEPDPEEEPEPEEPSTIPVSFTENIHESLPSDWVSEYNIIKTDLLELLPLYQTYYTDIVVYSWKDSVEDPYPGVSGGAYISVENNDPTRKRFVLEIPEPEFTYDSFHRYSVIAHEYFHCYQMSINEHMNLPNDDPDHFGIKWFVEGSAALFEGLYIRQNYNYDYTTYDQNQVDDAVFSDPVLFEKFDTSFDIDMNYSSSVFLVLALSKELQQRGYTEKDAFTSILKGFMSTSPQTITWEEDFSSFFGLTVDEFYATLPNYSGQTNTDLLPSDTLTLEQVFLD